MPLAPTTPKGRRTRAALVAAAREVFEELGYNTARISDITKKSKTSYGGFYHYFTSKDEILLEVLTVVAGEMFMASRAADDAVDDPLARIESANRQYLTALARNAKLMAIIEEGAFRDPAMRDLKMRLRAPYLQRVEAGIRDLQHQGLASRHLDPAMTALALGGMVEQLGHLWFMHGVDHDHELAISTLTTLWAQAIGLTVPEST